MSFCVVLTGDFFKDGEPVYPDFDLGVLDAAPGIERAAFEEHRPEVGADQLAGAQGVIVLTPKVTRQSLSRSQDLLAVARFGVGYDGVDVGACTEADVALCITEGAVDRPVAEATVGWMIGLGHRVLAKDRLVRTGEWDRRSEFMGCELRGRTLGVVGLGGIGKAVVELLKGFGMNRPLVFDPYLDDHTAARLNVEKTTLHDLMGRSDFVSVHCPLTDRTKGLIAGQELKLMKPTAFIINTARGGIIDEEALFDVLSKERIAGAAIDCFVDEPITRPHRFGELRNVLLAPHSIAWTQEMFRDIGAKACQSTIDLANGRRPGGVVNPEVFDRPSFQAKWRRLQVSV